jgi:hypothetical protein
MTLIEMLQFGFAIWVGYALGKYLGGHFGWIGWVCGIAVGIVLILERIGVLNIFSPILSFFYSFFRKIKRQKRK